ncbi:Putative ribosome-binding factor A, mitochondrial [Toxocara canis]|uniref:Putative ribosome-binding factor A, mitochondrial n=1 Tax=Toxocara canis TaxID=6265 RepID=A0A0B2UT50_TOXCA|nr:Putative ribosome-binding factor A, mitochondrial [Toxocara canis]
MRGLLRVWSNFEQSCSAALSSSCVQAASRRTGRGCSSVPTCKDEWRFRAATVKGFTRNMIRRFGIDTGLEDTMVLISAGSKGKRRKLDDRKRQQLGIIFAERLVDIIANDEKFASLGLQLSKVDVAPSFVDMRVFWLAKGDDTDQRTSEVLEQSASVIRKRLAESMSNFSVPQVKFIEDRSHLALMEMDQLFKVADYGMQYRAVSHTGAILGSPADAGILPGDKGRKVREKAIPKWEMDQLFKVADYGMQYRAVSHTGAILGSPADAGILPGDKGRKVREKAIPKWVRRKVSADEEEDANFGDVTTHSDG